MLKIYVSVTEIKEAFKKKPNRVRFFFRNKISWERLGDYQINTKILKLDEILTKSAAKYPKKVPEIFYL